MLTLTLKSVVRLVLLNIYINKGHDRVTIEFQFGENADQPRQVDEVSNYQEARYVSA